MMSPKGLATSFAEFRANTMCMIFFLLNSIMVTRTSACPGIFMRSDCVRHHAHSTHVFNSVFLSLATLTSWPEEALLWGPVLWSKDIQQHLRFVLNHQLPTVYSLMVTIKILVLMKYHWGSKVPTH